MDTAHPSPDSTATRELKFPADPVGRRAWILAALRLHGWTLGRIARDLGCSRSAPRQALVRPSLPMEREIARRIGIAPESIWPERYAARAARAARRGGAR